MRKEIKLITCVTNGRGIGPGHTAIAVGATVHSFENAGDWFSVRREESGWKSFAIPNSFQGLPSRLSERYRRKRRSDLERTCGYPRSPLGRLCQQDQGRLS
jgi:hypothetical protein